MALPARGLDKLEDKHYHFMDFLLSDDYIMGKKGLSLKSYADENHVSTRTLTNWKRDPRFKREWEERVYAQHRDPESLAELLSVLKRKAIEDGDIRAIELHMKLMDRMMPEKTIVTNEVSVAELTDDQIDALIADEAKKIKGARAEPSPQD